MAGSNIFGDLLMVFVISGFIMAISWLTLVLSGVSPDTSYRMAHGFTLIKTLELVALVTIIFTIIGIAVGYYYLDKELRLDKKAIFVTGFKTVKQLVLDIVQRLR
ncbi:hypothetical protein RZS08_37880, partial [Arthrospira platensis SPKY1]|nr:hypothetical protein [Arthrospira platensis SPKY1]